MPLKIERLSKRYGNNWALRDITFEVNNGEVFGIFGGTASGKSALLRVIAGEEVLNGGTIRIDESDITRIKERSIQYASSKISGFWASVMGRAETSSGESQIAAFEPAITAGRRITLFDEPFSAVDDLHRERLNRRLRELTADQKRIVIVASNDFQKISEICDRIAVLVRGELKQIGSPQEIYENPSCAAVAEITGRSNLFEARRVSSTNADQPEFYTIDGGHRLFAQAGEKRILGAINQNVRLAIRPEHISISFGASFPEDNLLKAMVTGIKFLGATTLIQLDAQGLLLEALVFRVVGLNIGEECMIAVPPHRVRVLKD